MLCKLVARKLYPGCENLISKTTTITVKVPLTQLSIPHPATFVDGEAAVRTQSGGRLTVCVR